MSALSQIEYGEGDLKKAKQQFEKHYIISALEMNQGIIARTARWLGMERSNLYRKLNEYGIKNSKAEKDLK